MNWKNEQKFELDWWGNCANSFGEEEKQLVYAKKMGLDFFHNGKSPYNIEMNGKRILDIGGGPISLLLKCENVDGTVADPCEYPDWVGQRYSECAIIYNKIKGEDVGFNQDKFDEVWIYNCLQHVDDPELIIKNALHIGKIVRLFEWIDTQKTKGHPHTLTEEKLNKWLGGVGKVEVLNEPTVNGKCYFGIFKGK